MHRMAKGLLLALLVGVIADATSAPFLNLSSQGLTDIPHRTDSGEILHLSLKNNRIREINCYVLLTFTGLQILDLSFNMIESIPSGCFRDLVNLKDLTLDGNPLGSLGYAIFEGPPLAFLSLRSTSLVMVSQIDFRGINAGLLVLLLGHNNLSSLPEATFEELTSLVSVELAFNQLEAVPSELLQTCRSTLRTADFSHNKLTSVPEDLFYGLEELRNVRLWGNPFSSDVIRLKVSSPNVTIQLCSGSCDSTRHPMLVLISEANTTSNESWNAMTQSYGPSIDNADMGSSGTPGGCTPLLLIAALLVETLAAYGLTVT